MNVDVEIDEDLIPYFECVNCGRKVCKDMVSVKLDTNFGRECLCLDCDQKVIL